MNGWRGPRIQEKAQESASGSSVRRVGRQSGPLETSVSIELPGGATMRPKRVARTSVNVWENNRHYE